MRRNAFRFCWRKHRQGSIADRGEPHFFRQRRQQFGAA
jgi:hypothetical protein